MLRGDWFKRYSIILIGIVLAALLIIGAAYVIKWGLERQIEYERYADEHRKEYTNNTYAPERQRCFRLAAGLQHDCITEARNEATAYNREQQDLVAQRVTALWTKLMGGAAIVGMVLSTLGVFLVWTTLNATREANRITRDSGLAQTRAWLNLCTIILQKMEVRADSIQGLATCNIKHQGSSPALATVVHIQLVDNFLKALTPIPIKQKTGMRGTRTGFAVFETTKTEVGFSVPPSELNMSAVFYFIKVSIQYQTAGSDEIHQSATQFRLFNRPQFVATDVYFPIDFSQLGNVEIRDIKMEPVGDVYAD